MSKPTDVTERPSRRYQDAARERTRNQLARLKDEVRAWARNADDPMHDLDRVAETLGHALEHIGRE